MLPSGPARPDLAYALQGDLADSLLPTEPRRTAAIGLRLRTLSWEESLTEEAVPKTIGRRFDVTQGASLRSTVFNLMSTCLGSGMLALPAMLARIGLGGGLVIMLGVSVIAERTVFLMVSSADLTGQRTLAAVAEHALGKAGAVMCAVTLIALNFGVCVSYCQVIKALLPQVLQALFALPAPPPVGACLTFVCVALLWPLSSLRTMEQLRFASMASIVLIYAFVAAVCVAGLHVLWYAWSSDPALLHAWLSQPMLRGSLLDWLREIPVVCFSYLCHANVLYLYEELRRQKRMASPSRWETKRGKMMAATRLALGS